MSIYSIPCNATDSDTYKVTLESVAYDFTIRYNAYDEAYTCFVGLTGQDPVCSFKLTNNRDLLKPYRYMSNVPQGKLFVFDSMYDTGRIDHDSFGQGQRFQLIYVTSDDSSTITTS